MLKKIISLLLCIPLLVICCAPVFALNTEARLYDVYGNGMLFQQNNEAVLSGTANSNDTINVQLFDFENNLVAQSSTKAKDNAFTISFNTPQGSFEEYTIVLTCNSVEFARLTNVVFGELWLSSGQSNMMYPLKYSKVGREMMEKHEKLSKWIRVLKEPGYPSYNGKPSDKNVPLDPQPDILGAKWINGESAEIYGVSAVAAFFAIDLAKSLNVPVGILNSSLGSSAIATWISRDAIDNCPEVKAALTEHNRYTEKDQWVEEEMSIFSDMAANFNLRTNALKNFRPSGMIWYQGETDILIGYTPEEYTAQLELLQKFYTEHFNYKDGLMPLIYTQLAANYYSETGLNLIDWNIEYTEFQNEDPSSRAVITNYDIPLTFVPRIGFIHPECKKEIGQRMAISASTLVYGNKSPYTAAYVESFEITGSDVYITFNNVGDTLKAKGSTLFGFAICGKDGIYLQADAEITSNNTVRVHCDSIKNPVSVTYAYCLGNYKANLYSSDNGNLYMPVSAFKIGTVENPHYWADKNWVDCEDFSLFHNYVNDFAGDYRAWEATNAKIEINEANAFSGENGLGIISLKNEFTVNPLMTYKDGTSYKTFQGEDTNYSDYYTMSFYVRNNGDKPVTLENVTLYKNEQTGYTPVNAVTGNIETKIHPDGKWHLVTFDLNTLYTADHSSKDTLSNDALDTVTDINFNFSADGEADISMDNIRFSTKKAFTHFFTQFIKKTYFIFLIILIITLIIILRRKIWKKHP